MIEFTYCPICATSLEIACVEGRDRKKCPKCDWIKYENPLPAVSALVSNDNDEILLIKRACDPCIGAWALPGGFVEIDETLKDAGKRELEEETGLRVTPGELIGVHLDICSVHRAVLVIGFEYFPESYDLKPGDDAQDARFFPKSNLPELPFESNKRLLQTYLGI